MNKVFTPSKLVDFEFISTEDGNGISFVSETIFHVVPTNLEGQLKEWCPKWAKTFEIVECIQGIKVRLGFQFVGSKNSTTIGNICTNELNVVYWETETNVNGELRLRSAKFQKI